MARTTLLTSTLLACSLFYAALFAQSWEWQNPLPQGNTLSDVTFVGENHGWAVGNLGTILYTSDGGTSWELQAAGYENLAAVEFVDTLQGWAVGGHTVLHTTNSGALWLPQAITDSATIRDIAMLDANIGWLVGGTQCYHTTNGGANWLYVSIPGDTDHVQVVFTDARHGWVLARPASVARTTDGGETWASSSMAVDWYFYSMDFVDSLTGWAAARRSVYPQYQRMAFRTTDGGLTWTNLASSTSSDLILLDFTDINHGWGIGSPMYADNTVLSYVVRTTDGGDSWSTINVVNGISWKHICVLPDSQVWTVGSAGHMQVIPEPGSLPEQISRHVSTADLKSIAFADDQLGMAVGTYIRDNGFIEFSAVMLFTTDGGGSWSRADSVPDVIILSTELLPSGLGWCVGGSAYGSSGSLWHTSNFGESWQQQALPCDDPLWDVEFVDDLHGFITCSNDYRPGHGALLQTTDGGLSWTPLYEDTTRVFHDLFALDLQTLWLTGDSGMVRFSNDGGLTWQPRDAPAIAAPFHQQLRVCFVDSLRGWLTNVYYSSLPCLGTTDGGRTWTDCGFRFNSMSFADHQYGLAVGPSGALRTMDGGLTWQPEGIPLAPSSLAAVHLLTPTQGWAVGDDGRILRYTGTLSSAPDPPILHPSAFILSAAPNPFNPSTRITFDLPVAGRVTLQIYDLTGRLVTTLANEVCAAGLHTRTFDGHALASGLYFARLQTTVHTQTQKLVLLK